MKRRNFIQRIASSGFALLAMTVAILAHAQDSINPYNIQQHANIILRDSDVYYAPFAPPGDSDTRQNLCDMSNFYQDPNGVGTGDVYVPLVYDNVHHRFDTLQNWAPKGIPIGPYTEWQRLFQALPKADGTPTNIIAGGDTGGRVTISKNEDVDFRASGRVILKSGFHAKPGCFFHAYTDPHWDTAVFSEEFDSGTSKWSIYNGITAKGGYKISECSFDSNVRIWNDTGIHGAHDGWALDLIYRFDSCSCDSVFESSVSCIDSIGLSHGLPKVYDTSASTAFVRSCPFPYAYNSPLNPPAYQHAPYGKYEYRDKTPIAHFHVNDWGIGGGQVFEYDLDETFNGQMGIRHANWGHSRTFGPCHGFFKFRGAPYNDTLFISHDDTAATSDYRPTGHPNDIIINKIGYGVNPWGEPGFLGWPKDTFKALLSGEWPLSYINSSDTFTFYYCRWNQLSSDSARWYVTKASDSQYRLFHAPYHFRGGDSIYFEKAYQPVVLTLSDTIGPKGDTIQKSYRCHWVYSLNNPTNNGILYMDDPLASGDFKSNTEQFLYDLADAYDGEPEHVVAPVLFGADTSGIYSVDSAAYVAEPYRYHTFAMEWLPHEVRILYDSVVVRRLPDRLIPLNSPFYDYVSSMARGGVNLIPGSLVSDNRVADEQSWFRALATTTGLGFWDVNGQHAAHHLIDYVKVWDVPKDVVVPDFPQ